MVLIRRTSFVATSGCRRRFMLIWGAAQLWALVLSCAIASAQRSVPHGWIGFAVDSSVAGARIRVIEANSPAAATDLAVGDEITAIDGTPVGYAGFVRTVSQAQPGRSIRFTVLRLGARLERSVVVATRPPSAGSKIDPDTRASVATVAADFLVAACRSLDGGAGVDTLLSSRGSLARPLLAVPRRCAPEPDGAFVLRSGDARYRFASSIAGLFALPLNAALASYFNTDASGLLIIDIARGSPADSAGFEPGDVVTHVGRSVPRGVADLMRASVNGPTVCEVLRHGRVISLMLPAVKAIR